MSATVATSHSGDRTAGLRFPPKILMGAALIAFVAVHVMGDGMIRAVAKPASADVTHHTLAAD